MAISSFQKNILSQGIIALSAIVVIGGLTGFVGSDIGKRADRLRALQEEQSFRSEAIQSFVSLRNEYSRAQSYFSFLESILPEEERLLNFPKDMKALAKKHAVDANVSFGAESAASETMPGHINFQMSVRGPLPGLYAFLEETKKSPYIIGLSSMELAWGAKDISGNIQGKVFWR